MEPPAQAWDAPRGTTTERGYGHKWQQARKRILREEPVCRVCNVRLSTEVDHVVPKYLGGTATRSNLRGICRRCHRMKSLKEATEARTQGGGGSEVF